MKKYSILIKDNKRSNKSQIIMEWWFNEKTKLKEILNLIDKLQNNYSKA